MSVRIAESWADLKSCLFLAHILSPHFINVCIRAGIEHLLVLDSFENALLGIIDETHVSGPPKGAGLARLSNDRGSLAALAGPVRTSDSGEVVSIWAHV